MPYISPDQYDTQFYYEDKGSGQPVVFAHGWSGSSRRFAEIARPLLDTGKFRIIVYDQRGHGASKGCEKGLSMEQLGRDLHTIIQALELKDVILAGHSMGAMTIYSYIEQFGCSNIKKCIFLDMSPKLLNDENWKYGYRVSEMTLEILEKQMDLICDDFDQFFFNFYCDMVPSLKALPPEVALLTYQGLVGINNRKILSLLWWAMCRADFRSAFDKITVPALYMYPEKGLYPLEVATDFMAKHTHGPFKAITIKNASHLLYVEYPEIVARAIIDFIG